MAKHATVVSIVPTVARTATVAPAGLPCPVIDQIDFQEALKRFGAQLELPKLNQRLHAEQVDAGMWDHLKTPVSTQATLEAVRVKIKGRRSRPMLILVDGFHRLYYWAMLGRCPFIKLNLIVHEIIANSDEEADDMVDALARTINSKNSVKRNTDFITAALRKADPAYKAMSKAYRLGTRAASYLKRTVGNPSHMSGPKLQAAAFGNLAAHHVMDELFHYVESQPHVKHRMAQVFHTGIATAIFDSMNQLTATPAHIYAKNCIKLSLEAATAPTVMRNAVTAKAPYAALVTVLRELADPAVNAELRAKGGNREGFYTQVSKYMESALASVNKVARRQK